MEQRHFFFVTVSIKTKKRLIGVSLISDLPDDNQTTSQTVEMSTTTTISTKNVFLEAQEDHPTSHFRPSEPEAPSTSTSTQRADVKIVKPKYGDFIPPLLDPEDIQNIEEKERIVRNNIADHG